MMLNRADEGRQRADECRRSAAQLVADDVLRGVFLDSARLWRKIAWQAQQKKLESNADTAPSSSADEIRGLGWVAFILEASHFA